MSAVEHDWAEQWLNQVEEGTVSMSQRTLRSVEKHGGLTAVREVAMRKKVHLVVLTDDRGTELVAASKHPFQVIC